jgi:hypothetical protein
MSAGACRRGATTTPVAGRFDGRFARLTPGWLFPVDGFGPEFVGVQAWFWLGLSLGSGASHAIRRTAPDRSLVALPTGITGSSSPYLHGVDVLTLDQQLHPGPPGGDEALGLDANEYGGYATAIFVAGWATGGLIFGAIGDRIGRARTLTLTVLLYSVFTGLSAFSTGVYDFCVYRFVTGLGVGGVFGLSVALLARPPGPGADGRPGSLRRCRRSATSMT